MSAPEERPVFVYQAGERRLARVESLRALAATSLVSGHIWGNAHGYAAFDTYSFVGRAVYGAAFSIYILLALTGYLLGWPFVRQYFGGGKAVALRSYALNRFWRLYPLYMLAIGLLLVLEHGGGSAEQWLLFIPLLENFSSEHIATIDGPLWTVVVEWHFYAFLPLLMFVLARLSRGSAARAGTMLAVLTLGSLALWLTQITFAEGPGNMWRWNLPANFFYFGAGMFVAFYRLRLERDRPSWLAGPLGSSDVWILASLPVWLLIFNNVKMLPVITVCAFLTLGAVVLPLRRGRFLRLLDVKALAILGVASYSLYVWHLPIVENINEIESLPDGTIALYAFALPLCIAAALLSFRFVEAPFLRMRQRWSPASAPIEPRREAAIEVDESGTPGQPHTTASTT